jgi:type IV secretory pathway TrbL component
MLLLLVSGWILAYAGIFFLGFGGARWTSDIAINYYKTVLNIAAQLFTMVLLVGIGKSFVDQYYSAMSAGISLKELVVMMVVAIVLLALVNKLPAMVGGLSMSGGAHAFGSGFGAGAAMGAVTMAGMAVAAGGTAVAAGLPNAARGTQSLFDAFTKASAADTSNDSLIGEVMAASPGSYGRTLSEPNTLAAAMGDGGSPGIRAAASRSSTSRIDTAQNKNNYYSKPTAQASSNMSTTGPETSQRNFKEENLAADKNNSLLGRVIN